MLESLPKVPRLQCDHLSKDALSQSYDPALKREFAGYPIISTKTKNEKSAFKINGYWSSHRFFFLMRK